MSEPADWDIEVDVVVVGGGACGVMTALRAAQDPDLVVAVLEKSTREGCNAAISSGSLAAGGTRFQRAAGVDDSPEQHARDILALSHDEEWAHIVHALCAVAPDVVEWLADELGYPIEIGLDMPRAGMSVPRLHADIGRLGGGRLMAHLRAALDRMPHVAFVDESPVVGVVVDGGTVVGVETVQNGQRQRVRADAVVLASDGFAASAELLHRHCPDIGDPFYGGVSTSTGDATRWLEPLGATFRNMAACLRSGLVVVDRGTRVSPALQFNGAVLVSTDGRRFTDEEAHGYSSMAGILREQPGERAAMIWDATAMATVRETEMMRDCLAAGAISDLPDVAAVGGVLGLTEQETARALAPLPDRRPLVAPFHLAWVTHGVLTTQGGVVVDTDGRVLDAHGDPVPGLYAGGGTVCGLAGPSSDGYSSGNGLLSALGFGWIIGNALAGAR
ncbi:FAD-dependent oxidoreductase [Aeromicrobium wangtongii]|uniref:FAD-dependent oxidoreductase n=1 Tax=Aeromicrobium wangtongii TaxID=2969247 RepID=A0ABY5M5K6_9ACTN|nr:FAD-dependent oxidoreductase [Aeromicrobium wangtongii]MCD9199823.1 FAD-dependent oxidoreductase [Aeromicrobium wangtongii]UUP13444.1 FAD-dependent oxidoreductase [Aeromicrobium wangtongii]